MLLYIMLCIMLVYLMLFAALINLFVCIMLIFLPLNIANYFCIHALSLVIDTICLLQILFCIIHSAFNQLVFLILCAL